MGLGSTNVDFFLSSNNLLCRILGPALTRNLLKQSEYSDDAQI
jgi:hypothetical protein